MGKTLATIGEIVTAGVLIATGIGAAAGVALGVGAAGGIAVAQSTIAIAGLSLSELSLVGIGLEAVGSFLQKPKVGGDYGTQVDWKADPTTGVPYIVGRTGIAGNIVLQDVAGSNNKYLFVTTALSAAGPVKSVSGYLADNVLVAFNNDGGEGASGGQQTTTLNVGSGVGATVVQVASTQGFAGGQTITVGGESVVIKTVYANGTELQLKSPLAQAHAAEAQVLGPAQTAFYANRMWRKVSLGPLNAPHLTFTATNSKDTPANHSGIPASWPASAKLSGIAHTIQAFEYDPAIYSTGEPTPLQVVEGTMAYDPRLDSTYTGGSGPQRPGDETTWGYSANPYIHALTWCLGRHVNGVRTVGVGAPIGAIDVAAFVNGANIADANKWTIGGQVYSTDGKWDVLTAFLQAGSGQPLKLGEMVSCMVNAPLVSLDTLTGADVIGTASFAGTQASRDRINAIWPRYRDESAGWQIVPTDAPITVPAYATADGGQRTKEVEYTLASGGPDHVATLARYDIENSREAGPHILPCKPRWMGYKPGDCITVNEPEFGLNGQKCLILNRGQDPATMAVTLTLRTETDGKHAFALGQTANAPPTPALTGIDPSVVSVPSATDWAAIGGASTSASGQSLPAILLTGACPDPTIADIIVEYRLASSSTIADWATLKANATSCTITGLAPQTSYVPRLRYRSVRGVVGDALELNAVTTGASVSGSFVGQGALATANQVAWATQVTGVGKPADNATDSVVYRQSSAPTGAGLDDIWVQTDGSGNPIAVLAWNGSSWIKGADVTGLFISAGIVNQGALATLNQATWATQITGVGKPEDYATKSVVYRQAAAPTGASLNDIWVQLNSGGFALAIYAWNGSTWLYGGDPTGNNIAAGIANQGQLATQSGITWSGGQLTGRPGNLAGLTGSEVLDNAQVPIGANTIIDSQFKRGSLFWGFGPNSSGLPGTLGANLNTGTAWYSGAQNVLYFTLAGTPGAGTVADAASAPLGLMEAQAGQRVYASIQAAHHRCGAEIYVTLYDRDGNVLGYIEPFGSASVAYDGAGAFGGANAENFADLYLFGDVPADGTYSAPVRFAQLVLRMTCPGGQANPYLFWEQPILTRVNPGQTARPPYQVGRPDPLADVTNQNTAAAIVNQSPFATTTRNIATLQRLDDTGRIINGFGLPYGVQTGYSVIFSPSPVLSSPSASELDIASSTVSFVGGVSIGPLPSATFMGLSASTVYIASYDLIDGVQGINLNESNVFLSDPAKFIVYGTQQTMNTSGTYTAPTYTGGGGRGGCPEPDCPIWLANAERTNVGGEISAGDLKPGMWVWTAHETTLRMGAYEVESVRTLHGERMRLHTSGESPSWCWSPDHLFMTMGGWRRLRDLKPGDEILGGDLVSAVTAADDGPVVAISVASARTFLADGMLSHNLKSLSS